MKPNIEKIEAFRRKKGWTRDAMAKWIGMSGPTYHETITRGGRASVVTLERLAAKRRYFVIF